MLELWSLGAKCLNSRIELSMAFKTNSTIQRNIHASMCEENQAKIRKD
jgi:hypothetical protein